MWSGHGPDLLDFQVYRWAVQTWWSGGNIMNVVPTIDDGSRLPWVYPPVALLPLTPFGLLPTVPGALLLHAIDLVALGTTFYLVAGQVWPAESTLTLVAVAIAGLPMALLLEPVGTSFELGQINIVLMALVALDCLTLGRRTRGTLVGLAMAIKLTPGAFLLLFVARRDLRAALTACVTALAATALGFVLSSQDSWNYWFRQGPATGVSGSVYYRNQSIMGALGRLGLSESLTYGIWILLSLTLVVIVGYALRRVTLSLALLATGLVALLVSPTSWSDHWVWVAPGLLLMAGYAVRERSRQWVWLAVGTFGLAELGALGLNHVRTKDVVHWTPWDHLADNIYVLTGIALLALLGARAARPHA